MLLLLALTLPTSVAQAAKWHTCPAPPFPTYPSIIGATNSPFIHPGHDLTIVLNEQEVTENGGFSTAPDGNEVHVHFVPPFGPPIEMAPIGIDAGTASLTFTFPEAKDEQGSPLVGPVEIVVFAGARTVAHIAAADLVAVPPSNNVEALLFGSAEPQVVYGALGTNGDLWVPTRFDGPIMEKEICPGDFIFPVSIRVGAARIEGSDDKREPLRQIRAVTGYIGDVNVFDYSLYGMLFQNRIRLVHVGSTLGVSICQLNDALDIVLRIRGDQSSTRSESSPLHSFVQSCGPVPLLLEAARTPPPQAAGPLAVHVDSFDHDCSGEP